MQARQALSLREILRLRACSAAIDNFCKALTTQQQEVDTFAREVKEFVDDVRVLEIKLARLKAQPGRFKVELLVDNSLPTLFEHDEYSVHHASVIRVESKDVVGSLPTNILSESSSIMERNNIVKETNRDGVTNTSNRPIKIEASSMTKIEQKTSLNIASPQSLVPHQLSKLSWVDHLWIETVGAWAKLYISDRVIIMVLVLIVILYHTEASEPLLARC